MASGSRKQRKRRAARRRGAQSGTVTSASERALEPDAEVDSTPKASARTAGAARRAKPGGPPPAPWGSFPLVEIAVLAGIIVLVIGVFFSSGTQQVVLVVAGLVLCSIAGLEVAVREHVGGYRSHTLVLSGVPAVAVLALLFYLAPSSFPQLARLGVGLAVFAVCAWALTSMFRSRSGGYAFRVRPERRR
jgi:hypothetical protein